MNAHLKAAACVVVCALLTPATATSPAAGSLAAGSLPAWSPADAPPLDAKHVNAIDALARDARAVVPLAGLSVGVLHHDAVFRGAWGWADDAPARDVTLSSTYRAASITKTFTAIVALQLANEGVLDLDRDVRDYVPAFPAKRWPISARALLQHTSGIGHYRSPRDALTRSPSTTRQALALFSSRPLAFEPGARFTYSSFGYNLVGAALEAATHERFGALLEARIFQPLGMTDTRLEVGPRGARDVDGFRLEGGKLKKSERIDISSRFASGGARSTVDDLLRFARALLQGALVDEATWRLMTTPTVTRDGRQADYGIGLAVYPLNGHAVVAHAGGQPETSSLLLLVPEQRVAIVLLTNVEGQGSELHRMAAAILEHLLDGGRPQRDVYAADVADELISDAMRRVFSYGLAARAAPAPTQPELAAAFAALGSLLTPATLRADPELARTAIVDAYHPASGGVTPRVGAEMTRVLVARGADRATLRARGPLAFFSAYVDACGAAAAPPCVHPLPRGLIDDVRRLSVAWEQTPASLRELRPEHIGDHLDAQLEALGALVGRPIHPSFRDDLERAAARLRNADRPAEAQRALALSAALHPVDPR